VALAFGYPAIPALRLEEGGVTFRLNRSVLMLGVLYSIWGFLLWRNRQNRRAMIMVGIVAAVYTVLAVSGLDQAVVLVSGHATQLLLAGVFLYRAWSGAAVVVSAERPLYAALGLQMVWIQLSFAYRILFNSDERWRYIERDGGNNDFVRLSEHLGMPMDLFLWFVLLGALSMPVLSFLALRYQPRWRRTLNLLFVRTDER